MADAALNGIEQSLAHECTDGECSTQDLQSIVDASLTSVAGQRGSPLLYRAGAWGIVGVAGAASFGCVYLLARIMPGSTGGILYGVWAYVGLDMLKHAISMETEPVHGNIRKMLWKIKNAYRVIDVRSMSPQEIHRVRNDNQQTILHPLEAQGQSRNNNVDIATTSRWIATHNALVAYLEVPKVLRNELRLESAARLFANAVPSAWLNCSTDIMPDDPVLTGGARELVADLLQKHAPELLPILEAEILAILKPTAQQRRYYQTFVRACLRPTAAFPSRETESVP